MHRIPTPAISTQPNMPHKSEMSQVFEVSTEEDGTVLSQDTRTALQQARIPNLNRQHHAYSIPAIPSFHAYNLHT